MRKYLCTWKMFRPKYGVASDTENVLGYEYVSTYAPVWADSEEDARNKCAMEYKIPIHEIEIVKPLWGVS